MQLLLGSELGSSEISEKMSELEKTNPESVINQDVKEEPKEIKVKVEEGDIVEPDISHESDIKNKLDESAPKEPETPSQSIDNSVNDESSINLDDGDDIDISDMSKLTNGIDVLEKDTIDLEGASDEVIASEEVQVDEEKKNTNESEASKDAKKLENFDTINLIDDNNEVKVDDPKNDDVVDLDSYNSDNASTKNDKEACSKSSIQSNEIDVLEIIEDKTHDSKEAVNIQVSGQTIPETKSSDKTEKVDTINLIEESVPAPDKEDKSAIDVVDLDIVSPEKVTTEDDTSKLKVEQEKKENTVDVVENKLEPKEKVVMGDNDNHKISNTLDITSDDDESAMKSKSMLKDGKSCVTIEDDDDIMVIDEVAEKNKENNGDIISDEPVKKVAAESTSDVEMKSQSVDLDEDVVMSTEVSEIGKEKKEDILMPPKDIEIEEKVNGIEKSVNQNITTKDKPLVPLNFIKSFKTTLKDMTRDDLEEFCLLKIIEGVVERSNMSEIKSKLKTLQQNVDDWRRKAMLLSKQHRDLQLVLKTVKEEQKKRLDEIVTPLKITRSVGLQLSRVDLSSTGVRTIIPTKHKSSASRAEQDVKSDLHNPSPKVDKPPNFKQDKQTSNATSPRSTYNPPPLVPIPVPRLVPASAAANTFPKITPRPTPQVQNPTVSSNGMANANKPTPAPNGLRKVPSPAQAPAKAAPKRTFNNIQSIDLTDDEPPSKQFVTISKFQNQRPQPRSNLMHNVPRMTYAVNPSSMNAPSPRQVYIPISGQPNQNTMRPGQTIMFKTVGNPGIQGNRMRNPQPTGLAKPGGVASNVMPYRNNQRQTPQSFHPAPLPHVFKQQQSASRKWLPPAPELKISKVDNGIVISWIMEGYVEGRFEEIASYQIYAYQETSAPPSTALWKKIGDVKALPLPMACTLTQFMAGYKYYFAVRAVDVTSRVGPFSLPGSILLINKK